ncbi:efflux RND transporter periplasmic adaptor subunit [Oceanicoccus sp. KOV_DT_Chl]|uniref:efflux RND transporter periplasmic adaptor subunit n=1 Tax=Oceanicoccus sp. KOV_DT_Chl TaxID=1904639 RepID=UPI0011AFCF25|nr:efflux RND transporter periplasmic adaptor subunit [Oceanicoccus sp. KOV_DT_Chl]
MPSFFSSALKFFQQIRQRRGGLPLMIIAVVAVILYLLILTRPRLEPQDIAEKEWVVEAITAQYQTVQPQLQLYGKVFAGRQSELRTQVAGNVVAVGEKFLEGGWVEKGDLLLQIDPFDYQNILEENRAQLAEARSKLELLTREYIRAQELFRKKDASQQFLDTAELTLEQQKSIVVQKGVGVKRAERDLANTKLLAPYDGVIDEVAAELGARLSTNDKVALVIDAQRLEVRFSLSNAQFGRILQQRGTVVGQAVDIRWQVGEQQYRYRGVVDRQGAQIASETGGVDMYAVIHATEKELQKAPLRPGAFVEVSLADRSYNNVLVVPETAVYGRSEVYAVVSDRLETRAIKVLGSYGSDLIIQSNVEPVIKNGEPIVVTQIREGGPGIKVNVSMVGDQLSATTPPPVVNQSDAL